MQMEEGSIKTEHFIQFLKSLFRIYKGLPFSIYLDNLSVHKNPGARQLCEDNNCQLLLSPPYSSQLNPIERLWAFAKAPFRKRCLLECDF
jgi:transposase